MIKSLYDAGRLLSQMDDFKDYFYPWANPFPKPRGDIKVLFAEINANVLGTELNVEDFKVGLVDKYLFREAKANATNLVPTFYLQTQTDALKQIESVRKMVNKVRASVTNYKHTFIRSDQIDAIEAMLQIYPLSTQTSYLFTIKVDGNYFGDLQANCDLFISDAYQKYSAGSSAMNKVCAVTYEASQEVWGRVDTLGFTVTDLAFARNGFDTAESYKMFPVSPGAVKTLEGAKRLIVDKLSRNFFGMKYFITPRFLGEISDTSAKLLWNEFLTTCNTDNVVLPNLSGSLIGNENTIKTILKSDMLSLSAVCYDIFFYQPNNAQFKIKLHVSDVLPSRFRCIMQVKEAMDRHYEPIVDSTPTFTKGVFEKFSITFSGIKDYFAKKERSDWTFHPYFFRIVEAVFYNQQLDREHLLRTFMNTIKLSFKNSREYPFQFSRDVRHTFVLLQFFYQLKLLSFSNQAPPEPQPVALTLETFEQQHPDMLTNSWRRAAFYIGCEVEMVLTKQYSFYKSRPFRQHLNGLDLDVEQLRKIHLKLSIKIDDYANRRVTDKRHFYPGELSRIYQLNAHIESALLLAGNELSKADLSYSFAVGMAMQKVFTLHQIHMNVRNKMDQIQPG